MADGKVLKDYTDSEIKEFSSLEKKAYDDAVSLNKQFTHINILLENLTNDWKEYLIFLEEEKISKICEFYGDDLAPFDDELRKAIAETLETSLKDVRKSINYNTKKIDIGRIVKNK